MNPLWTVCTHTYLLSASVLLACLLVTQSTSVFPNILLLLILAGHLFLLVKFGTVQYLMNLIDSLHKDKIVTLQPAPFPEMPPASIGRKAVEKTIIKEELPMETLRKTVRVKMRDITEQESTGKLIHHQSMELKRTDEKAETRLNRVVSFIGAERPKMVDKHVVSQMPPKDLAREIESREIKEINTKFEAFLDQCELSKAMLAKCVAHMKELLRKDLFQLIRQHQQNLGKLDRAISNNFNVRLKQTTAFDYKGLLIDLEDILAQHHYGEKTGAVLWKFAENRSLEERIQATKEIIRLCAEREQIDRCMMFRNERGEPYNRMLLFERLRLIHDKLSNVQHSRYELVPYPELANSELQANAFIGFCNRYLQPRGLTTLKPVRVYHVKLFEERDNPVILKKKHTWGYHFNVLENQKTYIGQPGPDNVYAVMSTVARLIRARRKDDERYKGLLLKFQLPKSLP